MSIIKGFSNEPMADTSICSPNWSAIRKTAHVSLSILQAKKICPESVSSTCRCPRRKMLNPSWLSRSEICLLRAGCVIFNGSAAQVQLSSSASVAAATCRRTFGETKASLLLETKNRNQNRLLQCRRPNPCYNGNGSSNTPERQQVVLRRNYDYYWP